MERGDTGRYLFVVLTVVAALLFSITYSDSLSSGLAVGNATVGVINEPPNFTTIPNQTLSMNTNFTINLSEFFVDPENVPLNFTATSPPYVTVYITGFNANVILDPDFNFTGNVSIVFTAFDFVHFVSSNNVTIEWNTTVAPTPVPTPAPSAGPGGAAAAPAAEGVPVEEAPRFAPEVAECIDKKYFIEDYFADQQTDSILLANVRRCNLIYFGFSEQFEQEPLAYALIQKIDLAENETDILFSDIVNETADISLVFGKEIVVDTDGDGLSDYFITLEAFNSPTSVDIRVRKATLVSLLFYEAKGLVRTSVFWIIMAFLVILTAIYLRYFLMQDSKFPRKLYK